MNANVVNVAVVDGKTITQTVELSATKTSQPVRIKAVRGGRYILAEGANGVAPENITIKRVGKDLHVALEGSDPDEPQLIIEDFEGSGGQLVGVAEDGSYHEYISSDAEQDRSAAFLIEGVQAPQVLGAQSLVGFGDGLVAGTGIGWFWPALLGLAALGVLGGVYAATRDDGKNGDDGAGAGNGNADKGSVGGVEDNVGSKQGLIESGGSTDDRTPTFTGEARPGTSVEIIDNGQTIGTAIVGDDGKWEYTPPEPGLDDGRHEIVIVPVDSSGNKGDPSPGYEVIVDTVAPLRPVIDGVYDDVAPQEGQIGSGGYTNDTTPTLSGTGEPNTIIHIYDGGMEIGSVLADAEGKWSFTPKPALIEGGHEFTVTSEDAAGNISIPSLPFPITVDISLPGKPGSGTGGIDDVLDNVGPEQGSIVDGGITDDNTPTLVGSGAEPGDTVIIIDNGVQIGTAMVGAEGSWEFTPDSVLVEGSHELVVVIKDPAGNESAPSDPHTIIVDVTAPDKPGVGTGGIDDVVDNVGPEQGSVGDGDSTDDTTPTFTGIGAEPGDTVTIIDNGVEIGTALVGADGNWEFTPDPELAEGAHEIVVVISDPAGNESEPSDPYTVIVDTTAPDKPGIGTGGIDDVQDNVGPEQGSIGDGDSTDDTTPTFTGSGAEPGDTVTIIDNGVEIGTALVGADGNWEFTPDPALIEGSHEVVVVITDPAGNESEPSDPYTIIVDTSAPVAPTLESVVDDQGAMTGELVSGQTTDDASPELSGTAEAGSLVTVYSNGKAIGSVIATGGTWTLTPAVPLANGSHSLTVTATDAAGNESAPTSDFDLTVAAGGVPAVPAIISVVDDQGDSQGVLGKNQYTDDAQPTVNGTGTAGHVISVFANGELLGTTTVGSNGQWSFTPTKPLAEGLNNLAAQASDAAGNPGPMTGTYPINVDTMAPDAPATQNLSDDVGAVTGPIKAGDTTDDANPTFSGTAEPGAVVVIYDGVKAIGSVTADATTGAWSFTPATALIDGAHSFAAQVIDRAGNVGPMGPVIPFTVDTAAVVISITSVTDNAGSVIGSLASGQATDDATPTLSGQATPGGIVSIYDGGLLLGTVVAKANGQWSYTTPVLSEGNHNLTATVTTAAGGESAPTSVFVANIDTAAPLTPSIGEVTDDVGAVQGSVSDGGSTDDTTPTLSGDGLQAGEIVEIFDGGALIGSTTVGADGSWSYTPTTPLNDGSHEFTVVIIDSAGNESEPSDPYTIIVDTSAPVAPTLESVVDDQGAMTGELVSGQTTDDASPELSGTAEAGSLVTVYSNGKAIGSVIATGGTWTLTPAVPLANGSHSLTVTATDAAGNESAPTSDFDLTVAAGGVPAVPAIISVVDDQGDSQGVLGKNQYTDDAQPTVNGTGTAGHVISVFANDQLLGTTTVGSNGQWSFTPTKPLAEGLNNLAAQASDAAGNPGPMTGTYPINVDTMAPDAPATQSLSDDVGAVTGPIKAGDTTDDANPTFSGTAEPGAVVVIYDGVKAIGSVTADATTGAWSFTPATALIDGAHSFAAQVIDRAGNVGPMGPVIPFTVDTSAVVISITSVMDNAGSVIGSLASGQATDDATPTLSGEATPGGIVSIYDGGLLLGTVVAKANGQWSYTTPVLSEGNHNLTATVTTAAGGESAPTSVFVANIDTTAPLTPSIGEVTDDVGAVQGSVSDGGSTDDTTPTLSGDGLQAGEIVEIFDGGALIGSTTVGADGSWSYTPTTPLNDGSHEFTVVIIDLAGNESEPSDPYTIIVDTSAPVAPTLESVVDDQGAMTGELVSGQTTDDASPELSGTAEAGSLVTVYSNGKAIGSVIATGGTWTLTPAVPLANGPHSLTVTATDSAGNLSAPTSSFDLNVVAGGAPAAPAIISVMDDQGGSQGALGQNQYTDDAQPTVNGTGTAGHVISVFANDQLLGTTTVGSNGQWSFTPTKPLAEGLNNLTAQATNSAGNPSPMTGAYPINVDTVAPGAPATQSLSDDVGAVTGPIKAGDTTDDTNPTFSGTAEPGAVVVIYDGVKAIGSVTADATTGAWSFTPATALIDGAHSFAAQVIDRAGNVGPMGPVIPFTVDTAAVVISITSVTDNAGSVIGSLASGQATDDATPTLSGQATPGGIVSIYDGSLLLGTVVAKANGQWSYTTPVLSEGNHNLTATVTTAAGGESAPTSVFVANIDTTAPLTPSIGEVTDDVGAVQGSVSDGGSTDDTTPTLSGDGLQAGEIVEVFDGGALIGSTTVGADGSWSYTPTTPLNDGSHEFTVVIIDSAGNESEPSDPYKIIVDTSAPVAPTLDSVVDDQGAITGKLISGQVTDDASPELSGTAEAGSLVTVYSNGKAIGSVIATGGTWTLTPAVPLANGPHSLTVTATDSAGNLSAPTSSFDLNVVAGGAPAAPAIISVMDDQGGSQGALGQNQYTDDAQPTVNGTGTAGHVISVFANDQLLGTTTVGSNGQWSFTPTKPLAEGLNNLTAQATNSAGNPSTMTGAYPINVDTVAPGVPAAQSLSDDVGAVTGPIKAGDTTDDTKPTFSGTAERGAVVVIYDGVKAIGSVTANATTGAWSFTPATALIDGAHSFAAQVIDRAGNVGPMGPAIPFTVDTSAPATPTIGAVADNVGAIQGQITNGGSTDDATPTLSGTGLTAGNIIVVYDGSKLIGSTTVRADGSWTYTPASALADGPHRFTIVATDPAGNSSSPSAPWTVIVDTSAPIAPVIVSLTDDSGADIGLGGATADQQPTVNGTAAPGGLVTIFVDKVAVGSVISDKATGDWTFEVPSSLALGNHDVTASVADAAGNSSPVSAVYPFGIGELVSVRETFEGETEKYFKVGEVLETSNNLILTVVQIGMQQAVYLQTFETFSPYLYVGRASKIKFEFPVEASEVSFKFAASMFGDANFKAYNADGKLIVYVPAEINKSEYTIEPPPGETIAYVIFDNPGDARSTFIDEIEWKGVDLDNAEREAVIEESESKIALSDALILVQGDISEHIEIDGDKHVLTITGGERVLDLRNLSASEMEKVVDVNVIDITGTGNNLLNLSVAEVLAYGETSLFTADETLQMTIKGDTGDVVNLEDLLPDGTDPGDWSTAGTATVAGVTYNVFQHSTLDAQLLIQDGVTTNVV